VPEYNIYLNDTSQYAQLGAVAHEKKIGIKIINGRLITIVPDKAYTSGESRSYKIKIASDGSAVIDFTAKFTGNTAEKIRRIITETNPEKKQRFLEKTSSRIVAACEVIDFQKANIDSYPVKLQWRIKSNNFAVLSEPYMYFDLPEFADFASAVNAPGEECRNMPIWRSEGKFIERIYNITLPRGYEVVIPRNAKLELGKYASSYYQEYTKTTPEGIYISGQLSLSPELTPAENAANLIELQRKLGSPAMKQISLQRTQNAHKDNH
jgi:hypothetical protein